VKAIFELSRDKKKRASIESSRANVAAEEDYS